MNSWKTIQLINFPKVEDTRGNLTFIEENDQIPFKVRRVYWIYDVPAGQIRGGHAFKKQQEVIIALSGSFDIVADNGTTIQTYSLNRSYFGLYIPPGIWRVMQNFSTNSVAIVLSSTYYHESDYIADYNEFQSFRVNKQNEK